MYRIKKPMENKKEHSQRIQTSLLNGVEKKALVWMAERLPSWVTSDMMTWVGTFGAFVVGLGFALTNYSPQWFWLASFGLVINWFGDSLDGTIARVRQQQRPVYGFYLDHNVDCICQLFIFGGAGLSCYLNLWLGLLTYAAYMMMEIYVMICAHLKNEFKLTYGKMGPTEFRVLVILINTVFILFPDFREWHVTYDILGNTLVMYSFDFIVVVIFLVLFVMYLNSFVTDAKYFAKLDPHPKNGTK